MTLRYIDAYTFDSTTHETGPGIMSDDVDRTAVNIHKLGEEPSDFAYWQSRSPKERLEALEAIRREYHGWTDDAYPRLQRVYRIIERS
jgi:hypothetical protein